MSRRTRRAAGQKLLAEFAGDWDVVKTFFPVTGSPRVTKGTCKQYMIQDGKFLQSDFTFFNPESKITTPVLGWLEDSVVRSDSPDFGVAESFSTCADTWIVC